MATTGSHLEALSAFAGFISSYLALMRVVSTVTQSKASIFLFVSILLAVKYEPQYLQQEWQLNELPFIFLLRIGRGSPGTHSSCRWWPGRYTGQPADIS